MLPWHWAGRVGPARLDAFGQLRQLLNHVVGAIDRRRHTVRRGRAARGRPRAARSGRPSRPASVDPFHLHGPGQFAATDAHLDGVVAGQHVGTAAAAESAGRIGILLIDRASRCARLLPLGGRSAGPTSSRLTPRALGRLRSVRTVFPHLSAMLIATSPCCRP